MQLKKTNLQHYDVLSQKQKRFIDISSIEQIWNLLKPWSFPTSSFEGIRGYINHPIIKWTFE